jgi:hypothetical protein
VVEQLTHEPKFEGLNLACVNTIGRKHQKVHLLPTSIVSKIGKHSPNNSKFNYFDLAAGGTGWRNCKNSTFLMSSCGSTVVEQLTRIPNLRV